MNTLRPFRFGVALSNARSKEDWIAKAKRVEDLLARRERYGISYITVFGDNLEAFAPVVAQLAGK